MKKKNLRGRKRHRTVQNGDVLYFILSCVLSNDPMTHRALRGGTFSPTGIRMVPAAWERASRHRRYVAKSAEMPGMNGTILR